MADWQTVEANSNLIQHRTEKSVLIKLPKSELKFWHPAKCVRTAGKSGYFMTISFTEDFSFKVFRNGKGKHNGREVIEERLLTVDEFKGFFQSAPE